MRAIARNALIAAVALIAAAAQAMPLCAPCCSTAAAPAALLSMPECCTAVVAISCPIADSQRPWLQQSRVLVSSVANPTFAISVPALPGVDARLIATAFHLPAFSPQVSPPLLI